MRHGLWAAPFAFALLVSIGSAAEAPADPSAALIGTWRGDVMMASGTYPRTLVIKGVRDAGGRRVADAEFGGPGNYGSADEPTRPIAVNLETFGDTVILRFTTYNAWPVKLSLHRDRRHLVGDLYLTYCLGAWGENPVRLTKVD